MVKPKISVVVIARNAQSTIDACLASLLKQKFKEYEILLVNDHSTDKTVERALKYKIRIINQKKERGVPAARNRGVIESKAEIVAFTDSDCIVPKNWLSNIYGNFKKDPELAGIGGSLKPYSKGWISECEGVYWNAIRASAKFQTANCAYRKEVLLNNPFDTIFTSGSDADLNIRLEKRGYKLSYDKDLIVLHHHRANLLKFIRHHFWYGKGKIQLIKKHPYWFGFADRNIMKIFTIAAIILFFSIVLFSQKTFLLLASFIILGIAASSFRRTGIMKNIIKKYGFFSLVKCWFLFPIIDIVNFLGMCYQKLL